MGGFAVLYAVDRNLTAQYVAERFRAAVAYYPGCDIPAATMTMTAPTLILIGETDEASPVERCREMVAHARPDGAPIALTVYPGAHHNFDVTQLTAGVRDLGNWLDTTSRRPRMRRRRRAPFSPRISAGDFPARRPQSEEARYGPTVLIAVFAGCSLARNGSKGVDPSGPISQTGAAALGALPSPISRWPSDRSCPLRDLPGAMPAGLSLRATRPWRGHRPNWRQNWLQRKVGSHA